MVEPASGVLARTGGPDSGDVEFWYGAVVAKVAKTFGDVRATETIGEYRYQIWGLDLPTTDDGTSHLV